MKRRRFSKNEVFDQFFFFLLKNQNDVVSLPMLINLTDHFNWYFRKYSLLEWSQLINRLNQQSRLTEPKIKLN